VTLRAEDPEQFPALLEVSDPEEPSLPPRCPSPLRPTTSAVCEAAKQQAPLAPFPLVAGAVVLAGRVSVEQDGVVVQGRVVLLVPGCMDCSCR